MRVGFKIEWLCIKSVLASEFENASNIKGRLEITVQAAIAKISAEAELELDTSTTKLAKKTKITIHGNLKKPILALNLFDLLEDLRMLRENPDEYLSSTPMFFSCLPLSSIFNREAINFARDLQKDQLREIYDLKANFQFQFQRINSLSRFAHDVSGAKMVASEDLPTVIDELIDIKQRFQSKFKGMQDKWIEIMARIVIQVSSESRSFSSRNKRTE